MSLHSQAMLCIPDSKRNTGQPKTCGLIDFHLPEAVTGFLFTYFYVTYLFYISIYYLKMMMIQSVTVFIMIISRLSFSTCVCVLRVTLLDF